MKKSIITFCVLALVTLALVGCVDLDEGKAKKAGEAFIKSIYTVDEKEVADFSVPVPPTITEEGPKGEENYKKQSDAFIETMKSIDKNIIDLMTKEGYEEASRNQFNVVSTKICASNNYTAQITDVVLGGNLYEGFVDTDKVRYLYVAELDFMSYDGKTILADTVKGGVELVKEDDKWKVCSLDIIKFPKLYK